MRGPPPDPTVAAVLTGAGNAQPAGPDRAFAAAPSAMVIAQALTAATVRGFMRPSAARQDNEKLIKQSRAQHHKLHVL